MTDDQLSWKNSGLAVLDDPQDCLNVFQNAPVGVFAFAPEGEFLSANPAMARLLGYHDLREKSEPFPDLATRMFADAQEREKFLEQRGGFGSELV